MEVRDLCNNKDQGRILKYNKTTRKHGNEEIISTKREYTPSGQSKSLSVNDEERKNVEKNKGMHVGYHGNSGTKGEHENVEDEIFWTSTDTQSASLHIHLGRCCR